MFALNKLITALLVVSVALVSADSPTTPAPSQAEPSPSNPSPTSAPANGNGNGSPSSGNGNGPPTCEVHDDCGSNQYCATIKSGSATALHCLGCGSCRGGQSPSNSRRRRSAERAFDGACPAKCLDDTTPESTTEASTSQAAVTDPTESSTVEAAALTDPTESSTVEAAAVTDPTESSTVEAAAVTDPTESSTVEAAAVTDPTESSTVEAAAVTESSTVEAAAVTDPTESSTVDATVPTESSTAAKPTCALVCFNNGVCIPATPLDGETCSCAVGYTGAQCSNIVPDVFSTSFALPVDYSLIDPAQNNQQSYTAVQQAVVAFLANNALPAASSVGLLPGSIVVQMEFTSAADRDAVVAWLTNHLACIQIDTSGLPSSADIFVSVICGNTPFTAFTCTAAPCNGGVCTELPIYGGAFCASCPVGTSGQYCETTPQSSSAAEATDTSSSATGGAGDSGAVSIWAGVAVGALLVLLLLLLAYKRRKSTEKSARVSSDSTDDLYAEPEAMHSTAHYSAAFRSEYLYSDDVYYAGKAEGKYNSVEPAYDAARVVDPTYSQAFPPSEYDTIAEATGTLRRTMYATASSGAASENPLYAVADADDSYVSISANPNPYATGNIAKDATYSLGNDEARDCPYAMASPVTLSPAHYAMPQRVAYASGDADCDDYAMPTPMYASADNDCEHYVTVLPSAECDYADANGGDNNAAYSIETASRPIIYDTAAATGACSVTTVANQSYGSATGDAAPSTDATYCRGNNTAAEDSLVYAVAEPGATEASLYSRIRSHGRRPMSKYNAIDATQRESFSSPPRPQRSGTMVSLGSPMQTRRGSASMYELGRSVEQGSPTVCLYEKSHVPPIYEVADSPLGTVRNPMYDFVDDDEHVDAANAHDYEDIDNNCVDC